MTDSDASRGLYRKYDIQRLNDPERKHFGCDYFVLDLTHDKHARAALSAYAASCVTEYPALAEDLRDLICESDPAACLSDYEESK